MDCGLDVQRAEWERGWMVLGDLLMPMQRRHVPVRLSSVSLFLYHCPRSLCHLDLTLCPVREG